MAPACQDSSEYPWPNKDFRGPWDFHRWKFDIANARSQVTASVKKFEDGYVRIRYESTARNTWWAKRSEAQFWSENETKTNLWACRNELKAVYQYWKHHTERVRWCELPASNPQRKSRYRESQRDIPAELCETQKESRCAWMDAGQRAQVELTRWQSTSYATRNVLIHWQSHAQVDGTSALQTRLLDDSEICTILSVVEREGTKRLIVKDLELPWTRTLQSVATFGFSQAVEEYPWEWDEATV